MISEIFDRKLFLQDQEIKFLEISIELKKLTNKIEEQLAKIDEQKKECDKIISDFEKDMEKEMLDDQKKIIKFETKKEGKVNMLSRAISVKADKKKNKLIPILTLNYFTKKGKKDGK
jgi:hypothetical protein